jgi:2-polyprenyl-3-methyl-5-hydroxy-6-metoxy-1,4-benzoquinol methylase
MSAEVWTHLWADWSVAEGRRTEAPVTLDAQTRQMVAANEADWDARAPLHAASRFYSQPAEYWFADYEWADLGRLDGRDVLHLQCHLGTETIAFARRGARVTGLDLSRKSLEEARQIAADAEQDIEYVYDAVDALRGRQFDVVYTGKGALCYLPDLQQWAEVVRDLLRPGGTLYTVEFHPMLNALREVSLPGESDDSPSAPTTSRAAARSPTTPPSPTPATRSRAGTAVTNGATASAKSSPPSRPQAST